MYWHCRKHVINPRPGDLPGLFCFRSRVEPSRIGANMTETYSKSRQRAEIAFGSVQTQFFANGEQSLFPQYAI